MRELTGIPHEHEIPAPVTTTIRLLFATAKDRLDNARLVGESEDDASKERVVTILRRVQRVVVVVGGLWERSR